MDRNKNRQYKKATKFWKILPFFWRYYIISNKTWRFCFKLCMNFIIVPTLVFCASRHPWPYYLTLVKTYKSKSPRDYCYHFDIEEVKMKAFILLALSTLASAQINGQPRSKYNIELTWFLKDEFRKIKFDELEFLSISNWIFTACLACKNQFRNWFLQAKNPVRWNWCLQLYFSKIKYRSTGGTIAYITVLSFKL